MLAETGRRDQESCRCKKLCEMQVVVLNGHSNCASQSSTLGTTTKSQPHTSPKPLSVAFITSKMKEMFETAIRSLYQAGKIIILPPNFIGQSSSPLSQTHPTRLNPKLHYPACLGPFRVDPGSSICVDKSHTLTKSMTSEFRMTSKS